MVFKPSIVLATGLAVSATFSCKSQEKFPSLDDKFATPTDVASDTTGNFFFVLSSDDTRDYNLGSIVTLTKDGEKVGVVNTPRLGRSLTVSNNDMLVTFANNGEGSGSRVDLYDVTDPKTPKLQVSWPMGDCNPINAVMRSGYKYFAVSCSNGQIYIGTLNTQRSSSEIKLVRRYPGAKRALYLDPVRNLLLAFPTDLRSNVSSDFQSDDIMTYSDDSETVAPNEIPDSMENSRVARRNLGRRGPYQFAVYNIGVEAAKDFPVELDYALVYAELRWMYFNLANFDGTPDVTQTSNTINSRYYRTNFWEAKPDPTSSDAILLSHRGTSDATKIGSPHANSIVRVRITGDLAINSAGVAPKTDEVLSFERVYGFKGELEESGRHFPSDFEVTNVNGEPLMIVNHARDIKNFPASHYSSLATKVLGDNGWFSEINDGQSGHTYFQIALTGSGRAMAVSFYQNLVILLDALPGTAITEFKTIN